MGRARGAPGQRLRAPERERALGAVGLVAPDQLVARAAVARAASRLRSAVAPPRRQLASSSTTTLCGGS